MIAVILPFGKREKLRVGFVNPATLHRSLI
jgi:hypothetical protein